LECRCYVFIVQLVTSKQPTNILKKSTDIRSPECAYPFRNTNRSDNHAFPSTSRKSELHHVAHEDFKLTPPHILPEGSPGFAPGHVSHLEARLPYDRIRLPYCVKIRHLCGERGEGRVLVLNFALSFYRLQRRPTIWISARIRF
jgi:hypothetical protein